MSNTAIEDTAFIDLLRYDKDTGKDAATCYDIVSRIFHGDFALTNKEILNG